MNPSVCMVPDCERPGHQLAPDKSNRLCKAHAARLRRWGDPLGGRPMNPRCAVEDCTRKHYCRGFCELHYSRFMRHGDPLAYIANNPRVEGTSYRLAHARLKSARGVASTHHCADCGQKAQDWAYLGGAPDERTEIGRRGKPQPYSENFDYYAPLCRMCHRRRDWVEKKSTCNYGHPFTPENTGMSKGRRRCRACARARYHEYKRRRKAAA